jgi:hypothetical protein
MLPVKTWIQRIHAHDFFDLESEELPPESPNAEEHDRESGETPPDSGYSPSCAEPEREITGFEVDGNGAS